MHVEGQIPSKLPYIFLIPQNRSHSMTPVNKALNIITFSSSIPPSKIHLTSAMATPLNGETLEILNDIQGGPRADHHKWSYGGAYNKWPSKMGKWGYKML